MEKPGVLVGAASGSAGVTAIEAMEASGGGWERRAWRKAARAGAGPSISMVTPEEELKTQPASEREWAS
jgi:hypothetical protein